MHLLFLGYSSIVRRRVLPGARSVPAIQFISVASRSQGRDGAEARAEGDRAVDRWYPDYEEALASAGADLVYVSGANADHAEWVMRALRHGCHVIVDKPAFLDPETAEAAVAPRAGAEPGPGRGDGLPVPPAGSGAARSPGPGRVGCHPRHRHVLVSAAAAGRLPLPRRLRRRQPLRPRPLRRRDEPAAVRRRPGRRTLQAVLSRDASRDGGVDTSFSVLLTHGDGGSLAGHFGFVTAYQNRLSMMTQFPRTIDADRLFTTPPDLACTLRVREGHDLRTLPVAPGDTFALFLEAFIDAMGRRDFGAFERALLDDAVLVARLRRAAGL